MKPTKSILDPTFKYTNAAKTDLRATFARVRREMKQASTPTTSASNVAPLHQRTA